MRRFSANLGFLWADLPLPDAIRAAKASGFDAVECHWPYETDPAEVRMALHETDLGMLGLNTARGNVAAGENGLLALPGRGAEARRAIDQALAYARAVEAGAVHAMAGVASGDEAEVTFRENLLYACAQAGEIQILIEPLNPYDAPGYFLRDTSHAAEVIAALKQPNLALMFDCYHVARTEGEVLSRFATCRDIIGHVQFAGVPHRGRPDDGTLDYNALFMGLDWDAPLGAEYKPGAPTEATLGWMEKLR